MFFLRLIIWILSPNTRREDPNDQVRFPLPCHEAESRHATLPPPSGALHVPIDNDVKMPDKKGAEKGGWAMRRMAVFLLASFIFGGAAQAKEYAIIKDTLFGSQKIQIYQNLKEALEDYTGEGVLYEITRKPVTLKRVEARKKVEISEYKWVVEEKAEKAAAKNTGKAAAGTR